MKTLSSAVFPEQVIHAAADADECQGLAESLGISGPSVSWHMKRLEQDSIVIPRRVGRVAVYEIPPQVAGYLARVVRAPSIVSITDCAGVTGNT